MGQVQNYFVYIKYRSTPQRNKAEECKSLQTTVHLLAILLPICSICSVYLQQGWENKTWTCQFCSSSFFLFRLYLFLFSDKHSSKTKWCANSIHTLFQTTALLPDISVFWFGAAYELHVHVWLESYGQETVPQCARHLSSSTSVSSVYALRVWHIKSGHT